MHSSSLARGLVVVESEGAALLSGLGGGGLPAAVGSLVAPGVLVDLGTGECAHHTLGVPHAVHVDNALGLGVVEDLAAVLAASAEPSVLQFVV
jgi:hypothetical protein